MPRVTSTKWDRTLVLNVPIFIAIWFGLQAALEIHFRLIIRHQVLGYRLNTYHLEVTGYSDDPWWREFCQTRIGIGITLAYRLLSYRSDSRVRGDYDRRPVPVCED